MAIDFPSSPTPGQEYTFGGRVWKWLGNAWASLGAVTSALSVIGRASNADGVAGAIVAANDGEVLRRSGTTLGFGQVAAAGLASGAVTTAKIGDSQVTLAKIQNIATNRFLGRTTAAAGVVEELTPTQATAMLDVATTSLKGLLHPADKGKLDITLGNNILINGDGRITNAEWLTTPVADDTYAGPDRWYNLSQSAPVAASQLNDGPPGLVYHHRLTQSDVTAQRMGRATIIESSETWKYRGKNVVLSGKIRCSSSQAIRYAILNWAGTADVVTSDVVLDWTSTTYASNAFFINTTPFVVAVGSITPSANTWTDITAITGAVAATVNNLIVFIWTEGTIAQNATLDFMLKLEEGSAATTMLPPEMAHETLRCMRYAFTLTWTMEGYANGFGSRIGAMAVFPTMRANPSRTRLSIQTSSNIRGGDTNTYVVTGLWTVTPRSVDMSAEADAAGFTQAINVKDRLSAEL